MASHPSSDTCAISILDLPKGSSLTLDGQTILLQRDDFVGVQGIPSNSDFHLIVTRAAGCGSKEEQKQGNVAAVSVGFIFETEKQTPLALVRQFDETTEEVSSKAVDDTTASNLCNTIRNGQVEPNRLIPYKEVVSKEQSTLWKYMTNFVSQRLLRDRGIQHGSKIVPGAYRDESAVASNTIQKVKMDAEHEIQDGSSIIYPPIPVLDSRKSARHSRHSGTKRYLASLSPSDRTALFLHDNPQNVLVDDILKSCYRSQWSDLLGDIQLSYILFLHLQCLSSLEHWRDLVAMLSNVDPDCVEENVDLYCHVLQVLARQVTTIEQDFFEDIETSGDNFLVPALKKLCQTTGEILDENLQNARTILCQILENRFRDAFSSISNSLQETGARGMQVESLRENNDDDDEDMPVVISNEEVEASLARTSQATPMKQTKTGPEQYPISLQRSYPVLFAAKMDHEDILMTCARALDDATDVSLVREAGTFLVEEVEPDTSNL